MAKRFRDVLRRVLPGARESSRRNAPQAPPGGAERREHVESAGPSPAEVAQPIAERSLAGYLAAAAELRDSACFAEADALLAEAMERFPDQARPRFEWALLPHFRLDWAEAVRRSEILRAEFPDAPAAHALGAIVLRELGRLDDAESLLSAARERFPEDLRIANESAWLATHRRDWAEALRRWGLVRTRFPDWPGGYTGLALVHRELRWFDEADATLSEAVERFPAEADCCIDFARIAETRDDWAEAALRWQLMRERFPEHAAGYEAGAAALRELGRLDEAEALLAKMPAPPPSETAAPIEDTGDEPPPHEPLAAVPELAHADAAGLADAIMSQPAEALASAPRDPAAALAIEPHVDVGPELRGAEAQPQQESEVAAAVRPHATAAQEPPNCPSANIAVAPEPAELNEFLAHVRDHRAALRFADAEAMLRSAEQKWPDEYGISEQRARLAEQKRDYETALSYWQRVKELAPDYWLSYAGPAACLRELGRYTEADPSLEAGQKLCPEQAELFIDYALVAAAQRDWANAEARERFPNIRIGYTGTAAALRELGHFQEADAVLLDAQQKFSGDPAVFIDFALSAETQGDWQGALDRWAAVRAKFPDEWSAYTRAASIYRELGRLEDAERLLTAGFQNCRPNDPTVRRHFVFNRLGLLKEEAKWRQLLTEVESELAQSQQQDPALQLYRLEALIEVGDLAAASEELEGLIDAGTHEIRVLAAAVQIALRTRQPHWICAIWRRLYEHRRAGIGPEAWAFYGALLFRNFAGAPGSEAFVEWILRQQRGVGFRDMPVGLDYIRGILLRPDLNGDACQQLKRIYENIPASELDFLTRILLGRFFEDVVPAQEIETFYINCFTEATAEDWPISAILTSVSRDSMPPDASIALEEAASRLLSNPEYLDSSNAPGLLLLLIAADCAHPELRDVLAKCIREVPDFQNREGLKDAAAVLASICSGLSTADDNQPAPVRHAPRRLRICMEISGQLRGFREAFNSWKRLGLGQHDTECVVHVWQRIGLKVPAEPATAERTFGGSFGRAFGQILLEREWAFVAQQ